jgi:hypothetical protein
MRHMINIFGILEDSTMISQTIMEKPDIGCLIYHCEEIIEKIKTFTPVKDLTYTADNIGHYAAF